MSLNKQQQMSMKKKVSKVAPMLRWISHLEFHNGQNNICLLMFFIYCVFFCFSYTVSAARMRLSTLQHPPGSPQSSSSTYSTPPHPRSTEATSLKPTQTSEATSLNPSGTSEAMSSEVAFLFYNFQIGFGVKSTLNSLQI